MNDKQVDKLYVMRVDILDPDGKIAKKKHAVGLFLPPSKLRTPDGQEFVGVDIVNPFGEEHNTWYKEGNHFGGKFFKESLGLLGRIVGADWEKILDAYQTSCISYKGEGFPDFELRPNLVRDNPRSVVEFRYHKLDDRDKKDFDSGCREGLDILSGLNCDSMGRKIGQTRWERRFGGQESK